MSEHRTRICTVCNQETADYTIDRTTLKPGTRSAPICMDCHARQTANLQEKALRNFKRGGTSSQAAAAAAIESPEKCAAILRQLVLDDLTPDELASTLGFVLNTARARCSDLKVFGFIEPTGQQRLTEANKKADVLRITDAGRRWLSERLPPSQ